MIQVYFFFHNPFRNLGLLHSHALDLVGCMHLSLGLSKSNVVEKNTLKNHIRIKIQRKSAHTWIQMFLDQFFVVKNMPRKIGESLLMVLPMCTSCKIPMQVACAHPVQFLCTRPMCILYGSHAYGLCDSNVILINPRSDDFPCVQAMKWQRPQG